MDRITRRNMLRVLAFGAAGTALAACAPQVIKETVVVEKAVEKEVTKVVTEKETVIVEATKVVEKVVTAAPSAQATTVTFVECWFGIPQFQDTVDPIAAEMSKQMKDAGINVNFRCMILDDRLNKYPILYASGADFTCAFDAPWVQMNPLREQGYLLPIEGLLKEHGPNIIKLVTQEVLDANVEFGHNWGIPAYYYYGQTSGVVIRTDLMKKYGAPEPDIKVGWKSLEPFLKIIKEKEPNMIPFANFLGDQLAMNGNKWPNRNYAPGGVGFGCAIPDFGKDTKYINSEEQAWVKESCDVSRSWWEQGLMNKTELAADTNVRESIFWPGKCAAYTENEPDYKYTDVQVGLAKVNKDWSCQGYDMSGQRAGTNKRPRMLKQWNFVVYNAQAPRDQRIAGIQVWDWISKSQDNLDTWLFGIDGKNYKKEPNMRFSEVPGVDQTRNYRRMWYVAGVPGKVVRLAIDLPKFAEDTLKFLSTAENFDPNPLENFAVSTKPVETELAAVRAANAEASFGVATGQMKTDEGLAKYKDLLDKAGRQKVREFMQGELDKYVATLKK